MLADLRAGLIENQYFSAPLDFCVHEATELHLLAARAVMAGVEQRGNKAACPFSAADA